MSNRIKTFFKSPLQAFFLITGLVLSNLTMAAGGPKASSINNPLAIMMIIIMVILLLIIALLANVLLGTAGYYTEKVKKEREKSSSPPPVSTLLAILLITGFPAMAQETGQSKLIGGLSAATFYLMAGVIFLETIVILAMLINLRILVAKEKAKAATAPAVTKQLYNRWKGWWAKANKFKPIHEEVQIDLGHDYDGIRELDNRLPPWWLYGFYLTILFAGIYLWRYHVSHAAPSSIEEYQIAQVKAERQKEEYLKKAAANVDENTVKLLTDAADLEAGGYVFQSNCAACHGKGSEGMVGPNLTDEYWLHGGSIKDIFKTIKYGVAEKGMKSWKEDLSPKQLAQLSSYIKSLEGTNPPNAKEKQGEPFREQAASDSSKKIIASSQKQ